MPLKSQIVSSSRPDDADMLIKEIICLDDLGNDRANRMLMAEENFWTISYDRASYKALQTLLLFCLFFCHVAFQVADRNVQRRKITTKQMINCAYIVLFARCRSIKEWDKI